MSQVKEQLDQMLGALTRASEVDAPTEGGGHQGDPELRRQFREMLEALRDGLPVLQTRDIAEDEITEEEADEQQRIDELAARLDRVESRMPERVYRRVHGSYILAEPGGIKVGDIILSGASTRDNAFECTGVAKSRTDFALLFAAVGTNYGVGDGSTTFNLPQFNSKVARGNTIGTGAGVDTHKHGGGTLATTDTHNHASPTATQMENEGAVNVTTGTDDWCTPIFHTHDYVTDQDGNGIPVGGETSEEDNIPAYTGVKFFIIYQT